MIVAFAHEALSIVTLNSGENMNCLVSKTQQTTFHGDNKINTTDIISFFIENGQELARTLEGSSFG